MKQILIVEDESIVALEIANYVNELGYKVVKSVSNAQNALDIVKANSVDLVLMDVEIKGDEDGISCAKSIKEICDIPIIYISAFSDDETLERAIQTQPSSYLVKPFNRKELKVAMSIAVKKYDTNMRVGNIIFDSEFSFDGESKELIYYGEIIHLTKQEQLLLILLISAKNSIISIDKVENEIWPYKSSNENTRRALIARLRSKLNHKFLETVHGMGYRLKI